MSGRTSGHGELGRATRWATVFGLALLVWLVACGGGPGDDETNREATGGENPATPPVVQSTFVTREVWLALVEEPKRHLESARKLYLEGDFDLASLELAKVAALLNFESPHSHSAAEEALLLDSVEELRRVARELRSQESRQAGPLSLTRLDRVEAMALRSIAAHQVALARDALEAGDARMAGALSRECALAIEAAFRRMGRDVGSGLAWKLGRAQVVGRQMEVDGEGSRAGALATLDDLDSAIIRLETILAAGGTDGR